VNNAVNDPELAIIAPDSDYFREAMHWVVNAEVPDGQDDPAVASLVRSAQDRLVNIEILVGGFLGRRLLTACLLVQSPGRVGMVLLPRETRTAIRETLGVRAVRYALDQAWQRGVQVVEALVPATGGDAQNILTAAGFRYLTTLQYLTRKNESKACSDGSSRPGISAHLETASFTKSNEPLFRDALAASYCQSLDCPELSGVRSLSDVLCTHAARRRFDPALWRVYLQGQMPAGIILLNPLDDLAGPDAPDNADTPEGMEIAYIGVAQPFRGTGLADAMLSWACAASRSSGATHLTLAVDERNDPARGLYARWGFSDTIRRRALVVMRP